MTSRVYIVIFFASAMCFFGVVMTEYLIPKEPYHRDGFGHADFPLPLNNASIDMKYRILSRSDNVFYIGGKGIFYRINPYDEGCKVAYPTIDIGTCAAGGGALPCSSVAPIGKEVDCHNYIRIVEEYTKDGQEKLLVCGTNALEPRCYTFIFDADKCEITLEQPAPADGIGMEDLCENEASYDAKDLAPRNWNLNYTYLWSGKDSSDSIIFSGVSKSYDKTDPIWAKHSVVKSRLGTETTPFDLELDTYEIESRAVNEANFVGKPHEYTRDGSTFVLFFYRETAVEFINHGKIVYSRVGRVCRDDMGNSLKWSSFLKARLNCSLPDDYPAYFNEIQDITTVDNEADGTSFYAVMATPSNGVSTSALCRYRLEHIHDLFQTSKFKSPSTSKSLWLPVDPAQEPRPRPGSDCLNPSDATTFIQNNPLLDELVENYNPAEPVEDRSDSPLFYSDEGGRFSAVVVDDRGTGDMDDNIFYIATETGNVLKAYNDSNGGNGWTVFRYWQHAGNVPINGLEFIPKDGDNGPWLFASTNDTLTRINLTHGQAQNQDQYNMVYYPYLLGKTLPEASGVIITHSNQSLTTTCDNGQINLFCEGRLDSSSGNGNITWYKEGQPVIDTELGHLLSQTHLTGSLSLHPASFLTILALDDRTDGRYSCEVWYDHDVPKERVDFNIEVITCITDDSVGDRKKEFEKVKSSAEYRDTKYADESVCVIEHPILCEQSCPYQ